MVASWADTSVDLSEVQTVELVGEAMIAGACILGFVCGFLTMWLRARSEHIAETRRKARETVFVKISESYPRVTR